MKLAPQTINKLYEFAYEYIGGDIYTTYGEEFERNLEILKFVNWIEDKSKEVKLTSE